MQEKLENIKVCFLPIFQTGLSIKKATKYHESYYIGKFIYHVVNRSKNKQDKQEK